MEQIELIIKLPKKSYEYIKKGDVGTQPHNTALLIKWIAEGTPLNNGIIATDKAIEIVRKYLGYNNETPYDTVDAIIEDILDESENEGTDNETD